MDSQPADFAPSESDPLRELLVDERRRLIKELVLRKERVRVEDLARHFGISAVTARSDLNALAAAGVLLRTHGGALAQREREREAEEVSLRVSASVKQSLRQEEKARIAAEAVKLIPDGGTILLDAGTTTGEIAKLVRTMKLTSLNVITNALNVAATLASVPTINLIMLGGQLRPNSYAFSGPQAMAALQGLHADVLFMGVDSLHPEIGLMTPHLLEAQLAGEMMKISRHSVAVADSSKLMKRSLSVIAALSQLHMLITDTDADPKIVDALRRRGVDVRLA